MPLQHPTGYYSILLPLLPDVSGITVVDAGCGCGTWGFLIRTIQYDDPPFQIIGIESHRPYLEFARVHRIYDETIVASIDHLPLRNRVAQVVLAVEVVEHLSPHRGRTAIDELNRIAAGTTLLTTPNGFLEINQPRNEFERHRSGWKVRDLRKMGFMVRGFGLKYAWKFERSSKNLASFLRWVATPFSFVVPQIAEYLIAFKRTRKA